MFHYGSTYIQFPLSLLVVVTIAMLIKPRSEWVKVTTLVTVLVELAVGHQLLLLTASKLVGFPSSIWDLSSLFSY